MKGGMHNGCMKITANQISMIIEIDDPPKFDLVSCVLVFSHIVMYACIHL